MSFDVLVHINENSQRGRIIKLMADTQNVSPEQIVEQIIDAGIKAHSNQLESQIDKVKSPAETLIGLFSSPSDSELIDEITSMVYEGRNSYSTRDIGM